MKVKLAQYGVLHDHASGKARVMKESDEVDFCGVFEPDSVAREAVENVDPYRDLNWFSCKEDMLNDETIDGIAIQGKVSDNLTFADEALSHNKHVWLDKPAGDSLQAFREVLAVANEKGLLVQFLLDWVASGRLGHIFSVRARISSGMVNQSHWDRWDSHGERDGGILFILACHLIDIIVALLGRPDTVTSHLRHDGDHFPWFKDNNVVVFEYSNAMAVLESTALEVASGTSRRIEVYGTQGSIIMEPLEPPQLRLCLDTNRDGYEKGWQVVPIEKRPRYVDSLRAFVADIRGEKEPDRSLEHEFIVQETVLRASRIESLGN